MTRTPFGRMLSEWSNENPLRKWRSENNVTIHQAASIFEVSPSTIQYWETGTNVPRYKNMDKLIKIVGEDAEKNWFTWMSAKPSIESIEEAK